MTARLTPSRIGKMGISEGSLKKLFLRNAHFSGFSIFAACDGSRNGRKNRVSHRFFNAGRRPLRSAHFSGFFNFPGLPACCQHAFRIGFSGAGSKALRKAHLIGISSFPHGFPHGLPAPPIPPLGAALRPGRAYRGKFEKEKRK
jgi:hypothetical protein